MSKFEKVEFKHAWEVARAVWEDKELYFKSKKGDCYERVYGQGEAIDLFHSNYKFYRKVKPKWWDKLDGKVGNAVLVYGVLDDMVYLATDWDGSEVTLNGAGLTRTAAVTPVPSKEVAMLLANIKEIENA